MIQTSQPGAKAPDAPVHGPFMTLFPGLPLGFRLRPPLWAVSYSVSHRRRSSRGQSADHRRARDPWPARAIAMAELWEAPPLGPDGAEHVAAGGLPARRRFNTRWLTATGLMARRRRR